MCEEREEVSVEIIREKLFIRNAECFFFFSLPVDVCNADVIYTLTLGGGTATQVLFSFARAQRRHSKSHSE